MNPMYTKILASIIRQSLAGLSAILVARGYVNGEEWEFLLAGLVGLLLTIGTSVWDKYKERLKLVTALGLEPMSEASLEAKIASGQVTPPSTTIDKLAQPAMLMRPPRP